MRPGKAGQRESNDVSHKVVVRNYCAPQALSRSPIGGETPTRKRQESCQSEGMADVSGSLRSGKAAIRKLEQSGESLFDWP